MKVGTEVIVERVAPQGYRGMNVEPRSWLNLPVSEVRWHRESGTIRVLSAAWRQSRKYDAN